MGSKIVAWWWRWVFVRNQRYGGVPHHYYVREDGRLVPYYDSPRAQVLLLKMGCYPCDGRAVSKKENARLYGLIGDKYGATDDTFNVPDLRP